MADAIVGAARRGTDVVGICAGQQVLGRRIVDDVESGAGTVEGIGLLAVETVFGVEKVVRRRTGRTSAGHRSEEHTSELQSLMRISYAVFCLKKKKINSQHIYTRHRNTL